MGNLVTVLRSSSVDVNRQLVLRSLWTTVLLYVAYRTLRFLNWYRRSFNYNNNVQGVKDYSWKTGNLHLEKEGPPKSRYLDFLDILLCARDADGKGLTPLEIRNEVDTFLFEGHDTTTSGISWTLHTLASRPEIPTRVQEELDSVLQDRESKHISWDDIPKLEYLTRCLKEGMRYHSPVPYVSRHLEKEMDFEGTVFPVGTVVGLGIWNVHHNPDVWEEPDKYDPDRFLPENIRKKDHYAYIPCLSIAIQWQ